MNFTYTFSIIRIYRFKCFVFKFLINMPIVKSIFIRIYFVISFILIVNLLNGQKKGVTPMAAKSNNDSMFRQTYAVVVGISDYQDPEIPDLKYADRDAEAFANYLREAGLETSEKVQLKLLLNSNATMAQFAIALDWLMENAKENDRVFIYFSGHGDVEKKTLTQPGFLLCWDAPGQVYMSGGTFALPMLQEVISTLSLQNKAKVIVITDACRSGKLSGSTINGNQLTNANLARQYANELKILSCQPDEFSLEGQQWGGGRGVFSYFLLEGLYGLADLNLDSIISSFELTRFLEDHIPQEVAPLKQLPLLVGNKSESIGKVARGMKGGWESSKGDSWSNFNALENQGIEDLVLKKLSPSVLTDYKKFQQSLINKNFFQPDTDCSEFYYQKLIQQVSLLPLHSTLKRNYAAALQDDAQQVLNKWFKSDPEEFALSKKQKEEKYNKYPGYLERAAELLGKDHYMYQNLRARKLFFEGYLLVLENKTPIPSAGEAALKKFHQALAIEPEFTQAYWQISLIYGFHILNADSLEFYTQKAIDQAPTWVAPYDWITFFLSARFGLYDKAKYYLDLGLKMDPNDLGLISNLAIYYEGIGNLKGAEEQYLKLVKLDSLHAPYYNMAYMYFYTGRTDTAIQIFKKGLAIDATNDFYYSGLGFLCLVNESYAEAENYLLKAIQLSPLYEENYLRLAEVYNHTGRKDLEQAQYQKVLELLTDMNDVFQFYALGRAYSGLNQKDNLKFLIEKSLLKWPGDPNIEYFIACLHANNHEDDQSMFWLEKSLNKGFTNFQWILYDSEWKRFQQNEDYKNLIKKFFPKNKAK